MRSDNRISLSTGYSICGHSLPLLSKKHIKSSGNSTAQAFKNCIASKYELTNLELTSPHMSKSSNGIFSVLAQPYIPASKQPRKYNSKSLDNNIPVHQMKFEMWDKNKLTRSKPKQQGNSLQGSTYFHRPPPTPHHPLAWSSPSPPPTPAPQQPQYYVPKKRTRSHKPIIVPLQTPEDSAIMPVVSKVNRMAFTDTLKIAEEKEATKSQPHKKNNYYASYDLKERRDSNLVGIDDGAVVKSTSMVLQKGAAKDGFGHPKIVETNQQKVMKKKSKVNSISFLNTRSTVISNGTQNKNSGLGSVQDSKPQLSVSQTIPNSTSFSREKVGVPRVQVVDNVRTDWDNLGGRISAWDTHDLLLQYHDDTQSENEDIQ